MSGIRACIISVHRWVALLLMACCVAGAVEITDLSPAIGTPVGGTLVTITGVGLTGTSSVRFGSTAATAITVVNDTTVTCLTPAGSVGSVGVSLTATAGTVTSPSTFAYVAQSSSPKKGVGLWSTAGSTTGLSNIRSAWAYNWWPERLGFNLPAGTAYVPMIWGDKHLNTTDIAKAQASGSTNLLGFNEPDHTDQSNMTVAAALAAWPQLMATGMRLGSPSPASGANTTGGWLDLFMKGVKTNNYRVDFICLHWYSPNYDAAYATGRLKSYLESNYAIHKKPIWLTEFALKNWSSGAASATAAQQVAFMQLALPMLESLPYVERYSWFCLPPGWGETWSLTDDSGALIPQGIAYRDLATYATGIPATPTGLTATPIPGTAQVNLAWTDAANNDAGTRIERKIGAGGTWAEIDALYAPDQTVYSNIGLTAGTTYFYRVVAFNADGSSSASNEASATVVANVAPTVATAATCTPNPVTATTAILSALGADADGGESALIYTWSTAVTPPAAVTYSVNGTNGAKSTTATFTKAGNYSLRVTIKDAGGLSVTSTVAVTVSPLLTSIVLTPATATLRNNVTQQFTASAKDQFGAALASQPVLTWELPVGGGSLDSTGFYTAPSSGTGTATIRATSGAVQSTAIVTLTASGNTAPTVATAAACSPSPVTSTTATLSVLGTDDGGENALTYTWVVTGTPPAAVTFSANGTNAAKSTTATFTKPGSYTFQATVADTGGLSATTSVTVAVNVTLSAIVLTPGTASVANGATQSFTASAKDQFGTTLATQPTFTWTVMSGGAGGTVSSAGLYTAPATGTGTTTVRAASGAVNGTALVSVSGGANTAPTVATAAMVSSSPVTGLTATLSVLGADSGGEASLVYTWATTGTPPAAVTFSANGTNAAKSTVATFTKAGTYAFQVTIADAGNLTVTSSLAVTVNQTPDLVAITPSLASVDLGASQEFIATASDQFGVLMVTPPTFAWSVGSGGIGTIDVDGLYTAPSSGSGATTIRVTAGSASAEATVLVANATPSVATPAAAGALVGGTVSAVTVQGADDGDVAALTYTWATIGTPPAAVVFAANGTNAAQSTTATFAKAGIYDLQVTITDAGGLATTSSVTVTVQATPTTLIVTPATAQLVNLGTQAFTVATADQFGTLLDLQPTVTWVVDTGIGAVSTAGLYTAPGTTTGSATVRATSGGISGTAAVTVVNAAPTVATAANAGAGLVTGTSASLTILGADDAGEAALSYTWSTFGTPPAPVTFVDNGTNAAKSTTAVFARSGSYSLQATITDGCGRTVASAVTVVVQGTLSAITVSPATATLLNRGTQRLTAQAKDQFGMALAAQPIFSWALDSGIGTVSATGLYTAPAVATGTAIVAAASGGVRGLATLTVANATPLVVMAPSSGSAPVTGTSTSLSVLGTDDGGEASLTYTWSTIGTPPAPVTFRVNGTNAAKSTTVTFTCAGTYEMLVTIADAGGLTTTGTLTVVVEPVLTVLAVDPAQSTVIAGTSQVFGVISADQFGTPMVLAPTWSVSGGGSIDAGGRFQASVNSDASARGVWTVTALTAGRTATARVTVVADPLLPDAIPPVMGSLVVPLIVTGRQVTVTVAATDDLGVVSYLWTLPTGVTVSSTTSSSPVLTFSAAGSSTVEVIAVDAAGNRSPAATATITVSALATVLRLADLGVTSVPGDLVTVRGLVTDQFGADMVPTGVTWSWQVTGATRRSSDGSSCTIAVPLSGVMVVGATLTMGGATLTAQQESRIEELVPTDQGRPAAGGCGGGSGAALLVLLTLGWLWRRP